jgi:glycosyltransferase involved in cell wall biosynthesis/CDP-glycerol glycerophosphotransferase (TagB/SpsB family)
MTYSKTTTWSQTRAATSVAQLRREIKRRKLVLYARAWIQLNPAAANELRRERAWIIGNAGGAFYGDNSAALHQHLRRNHPELSVYWVIDRDSPDQEQARSVGPVIFSDDVMTYVRVLLASVHVISHGVHDVPGSVYGGSDGIIRVRLGHGLTALKKTKPRRGHSNQSANAVFDLVPVCSEFERANKLEWGIDPERLVITGIPRFDTLLQKQRLYPADARRLLYMPTWRDEVASAGGWEHTTFFRGVTGFLCDSNLHRLLNQHGATLDVFLHINLKSHVRDLGERLEGTPVRLTSTTDPQRLLAESGLLITDYSSVAWDVLYLDKPVVFYHFDVADHCGGRGGHIAFDDTLPGPSLRTPQTLIDTVEQHLRGSLMEQPGYAERMARWQRTAFAFRDDCNAARVTAAVMKMLAERERSPTPRYSRDASAARNTSSAKMPHRLLFVVTGLGFGGAESQVIDLARTLSRRGWKVAVATLLHCAERRSDLEQEGIPVHTLGMTRGYPDPRAMMRLANIVRDFGPTVVHAHMVHANLLTRLTRILAPVPVLVSSAHNVDEGRSWRMWAYRATDRLTNLTTNVSPAAVARSVDRGAVPRNRIRYMPNGIDISRFASDAHGRLRMRQELETGDRFLWLCVASFEKQKDYPNLFDALHLLRAHPARPLVLAVGGGSLQDELKAMAAGSVPEMIRFLGVRSDVQALMTAADAYVLPSAWEGLPLVLLEASASSLPIVCTDVGGNREIVKEGETGFVVPPRNPGVLADAMARIMHLPLEERERLGARARLHVNETFSLDSIATRWEDIYADLFNDGCGRARAGRARSMPLNES